MSKLFFFSLFLFWLFQHQRLQKLREEKKKEIFFFKKTKLGSGFDAFIVERLKRKWNAVGFFTSFFTIPFFMHWKTKSTLQSQASGRIHCYETSRKENSIATLKEYEIVGLSEFASFLSLKLCWNFLIAS